MKINSKIFRSYDIRGVYPKEINEEIAYAVGRAYVLFLKKKKPKIVIGRDGRSSSLAIFKALMKGITDQGADVVNIGLSTSPMLYWTCGHYKFDGGINITASHNPSNENGFKFVKGGAIPVSIKSGLKEIKQLLLMGKFEEVKKGKIIKKNIIKEYLDFNFKEFNLKKIKKIKVVVDTANAVPGILNSYLRKKIPIRFYFLFEKLDGSFPNHQPNPLIDKNLKSLRKVVRDKKADFGLALDGDGDRLRFVDEKGEIISGDLITAFLASLLLKKKKAKILYDIRSSRTVEEVIREYGGKPVIWRVGHSFIKEKMRKDNILFAGELSGHYYKKDHYFSEVPIFVLLKFIQEVSDSKKKLSEMIKPYKRYFSSGEINFKIRDKGKVLKVIEKKFKTGKVSKLDGLRIDFKEWWFLVRPSGTEDILRLIVEAKTKRLMNQRKRELVNLITPFSS